VRLSNRRKLKPNYLEKTVKNLLKNTKSFRAKFFLLSSVSGPISWRFWVRPKVRKFTAIILALLLLFPILQYFQRVFPQLTFAAEYITDTDHGGADWTLADGDVIAGNHTNIGTFTIPGGATISVKNYNGSIYGSVSVFAVTINIQGTLTGDGSGFVGGAAGVAGSGPGGGGVCSGNSGGAGGGYGGVGGSTSGATGGSTYGSVTSPTDLGSGGSGGCGSGSASGDAGGGAIRLDATGTITIDGVIRANGSDGNAADYGGGGGSGGSVYITSASLAGSGSVLAEGATGGSGVNDPGAGGGGGRVSMKFTVSDSFSGSGTISVAAGSPGNPGEGTSIVKDPLFQTDSSDTMTRHKISTASDHTISFGAPAAVDDSADTIIVTFAGGFDLSSITISDVDFEVSGADKTLAASPANGVWGYSRSGQAITFTAPTDASIGEIEVSESVTVKIGTVADGGSNQIINPSSIGGHEITITGSQFEIEVPIMDDDQISISAAVDTFITFDLDTPAGSGGSHSETATPYSVDLQDLTFSSITDEDTASVTEIYVDLDTNADDGAIIQVLSANGATGLSSASSGDAISSSTATLATNTTNGGYGLASDENAAASEGTLTEVSPFNVFGTSGGVGGLTTSFQTIFNTGSDPIVGGDGKIAVRAVAGKSTSAADDYTDTLTFRATATY